MRGFLAVLAAAIFASSLVAYGYEVSGFRMGMTTAEVNKVIASRKWQRVKKDDFGIWAFVTPSHYYYLSMYKGKLSLLNIFYPPSFSRYIGFVAQMRKKYGEPFAVDPLLPDPRLLHSRHALEIWWKGANYRVSVKYHEDEKPEDNVKSGELYIVYYSGIEAPKPTEAE